MAVVAGPVGGDHSGYSRGGAVPLRTEGAARRWERVERGEQGGRRARLLGLQPQQLVTGQLSRESA